MRALVVDDDFSNRMMLQRFLHGVGEVDIAVDGEEAVEAVRLALSTDEPYSLICLDILMPGLDGHEVLKSLRDLEEQNKLPSNKRAKVIMTTGLGSKDQVMSAFREQADAYFVKPVMKDRLLETVRQWGLM
jgi:two-component system chemotaxis response regulator CheY